MQAQVSFTQNGAFVRIADTMISDHFLCINIEAPDAELAAVRGYMLAKQHGMQFENIIVHDRELEQEESVLRMTLARAQQLTFAAVL